MIISISQMGELRFGGVKENLRLTHMGNSR